MRSAALILFVAATALSTGVSLGPAADATPASCYDERLCSDLGEAYYCPDTGRISGPFAPCPSLVTGPYAPGGLRPNSGLSPKD